MKNIDSLTFLQNITQPFRHVRGYGYEYLLPEGMEDVSNISGQSMRSPFVLCEDGMPLPGQHAQNICIWYSGGGHYNHWGRALYFSTSDNSDPNTNGKHYTLMRTKQNATEQSTPFPQRVHIVLSHSCNLWCRICREKYFSGPFMDMSLFDKIAEEMFPHVTELRLDSGGEILLNKDLPTILKKITNHRVPFFTSSNGMLLTPKKSRQLAESSLHHIQISLDSPVKNTLEWIRRGANFERIIQGVNHLVQARREVGRPFLITFHAAVMRENVRQLPDLVRLAHSLGVEGVTACHLFTHACMDINSSCYWNQPEYNDMLAETIELAKSLNSFFYGPQPFSSSDATPDTEAGFCDYPEHGTYINPDGTVLPCCVAPLMTFGNVREQSFASIWNGEAYRQLRDTYRTETPSFPHCKNCLAKKDNSKSYMSYFAPEHWPAVRQNITSINETSR